jgi:hypothetical protein
MMRRLRKTMLRGGNGEVSEDWVPDEGYVDSEADVERVNELPPRDCLI